MRKLKWLLAVMLPVWPLMLLAVISGVLTIGSSIALLAVAAWLIATAAFHPPLSELSLAIVGVRFFGLARAGLRYAERYLSHEATFRILSQVRVYVYKVSEAAFSANLALFRDGALLDRLVSDVETLQYFFLRVFAPLLTALIAGTAVSLVFAGYATGLAGIFLTMAVGSLAVSFMLYRLQQWRAVAVPVRREELKSSFLDVFSGLEELTAIDGQLAFEERLYAAGAALTKAQERTAVLTAAFDFAGNLASSAAVWLALLFVAMAAGQGACAGANAAVLVIVMQSSMEIIAPFFLLPYHWHDSALAAARIDELAGQRSDYGQIVERRPPVLSRELCWEFHGVSFAYTSGQQPALRDVSLRLPAGGKVAIVGASGAGKTTLLKVLLGQWDYQGNIFLNGQELRQFSPQAIRSLCGVVSQDSYLFCAAISDNLRLARSSAGNDELAEAAAKAGISQFIEELPDGYETLVGQQGMALSGGQRRRLTIARALLKDAPLLVLDEPCAGLDNITAREVMRHIGQSAVGRSLLLVTHRLQDLAQMDEIIVMEQGRIAERGTQRELLKRNGVFYRLWQVQHDLL